MTEPLTPSRIPGGPGGAINLRDLIKSSDSGSEPNTPTKDFWKPNQGSDSGSPTTGFSYSKNYLKTHSSEPGTPSPMSDAKKLQNKLENASRASHRLRLRITMCTTVAGLVPFLGGVIMWWLIFWYLNPYDVGHAGFYGSLLSWSACLTLLGVLPNDAVLIRVLNIVAVGVLFSTTLMYTLGSSAILAGHMAMPQQDRNADDPTTYFCNITKLSLSCVLLVSRRLVVALIALVLGCTVATNLVTHKGIGSVILDLRKRRGFRFNDEAFKIPARITLSKIWLHVRLWFGLVGFGVLIYSIIFYYHAVEIGWYGDWMFVSDLCMAFSWMTPVFFFTDDRRRRIMGFLTSINSRGEAMAAASIAALLGGHKASDSLSLAKEKFRSISFTHLEEPHFEFNRETLGSTNNLFEKTKPVKLGACDAFVSHSWQDNGQKKYEALKTWCDKFHTRYGRHPQLWFDKACIDQKDISNALLCLPIFLAGCSRLLIFAGETYTQRLWCIMEVFVFLKMGGSIDRITVLPIGMEDEEAAKAHFSEVDVESGQCGLESDRQKLLAIVEQGFGNYDEFNEIVRHVFEKRMKRGSVDSLPITQGTKKKWSLVKAWSMEKKVQSIKERYSGTLPNIKDRYSRSSFGHVQRASSKSLPTNIAEVHPIDEDRSARRSVDEKRGERF